MSEAQWNNLPSRPVQPAYGWSGFSLDPRLPDNAPLRTSEADRQHAAGLVEAAFLAGRLDVGERDERLAAAGTASTYGELMTLVRDLPVGGSDSAPTPQSFVTIGRSVPSKSATVRAFIGAAIFFNLIWLLTAISSGHALYYWPMWPMLGLAIPVILRYIIRGGEAPGAAADRYEARLQAREQRRALRAARRGRIPPQLPPPPSDLR